MYTLYTTQSLQITHVSHLLGNIYLSDYGNNRVRKVLISTSLISTIAGTGSTTYSGDNGQASSAALYYPVGVAVDTSGKSVAIKIAVAFLY